MKSNEIQDLIHLIAKSSISEIELEMKEFKIKIKNPSPGPVMTTAMQTAALIQAKPIAVQETPTLEKEPAHPDELRYVTVKSPMIGTFYLKPGIDKPPFVKIGDEVKVGQTLCIVEAMKLFNEIESEVSGKIVEILIGNASPIEYDSHLFLIDPS